MRNPVSDNGTARGSGRWLLATVSKALDVLELFSDTTRDLSLTEIAELAELPKSSTFRYLATLESRGYLQRDPQTERYHLGLAIMRLGAVATQRLDVRQVAEPLMRELRDTYRETVNLAVPASNGRIVYIEVVEANQVVKMAARVGDEDYAHTAALGKAMMAMMSEIQWERLKPRSLPQRTEYSIIDWPSLMRELDQIRKRGFAIDDRESNAQVRCVGVPILDRRGEVIAGLSISGPANRLTVACALEIGPALVGVGRRISAQVGYEKRLVEGGGATS